MHEEGQGPSVHLLQWMLMAREGDRREGILLRQGKGWFHLPCTGHEALAVLGYHLRPEDYLFPHYRDRALMLARGMGAEQLARDYFARAGSSSEGRNLPSHFSSGPLNIVSIASPTGSQCLPAVGCAWGAKLSAVGTLAGCARGERLPGWPRSVVVCCLGDAATRQGEFYEAVCFAVQEALPIVFVVEDNGYGISTPTLRMLPFRLGIFNSELVLRINGRDVYELFEASGKAIDKARSGKGPTVFWCELDRLCSHTSSDDHRIYRSQDEIERLFAADPVQLFASRLIDSGHLTNEEFQDMQEQVERTIDDLYRHVERQPAPDPGAIMDNLFGPSVKHLPPVFQSEDVRTSIVGSGRLTMVEAINQTFHAALERFPNMLLFGEDIEDPKGGVFKFTAGLSSRFAGRVVNSPLAEGTIIGLGVGLAASGYRPVVEIQFIDFLAPGFNQLVTQAATLRWRSNGDWSCPLVIYAPYGAYLPAGGMWHSQSNDGWWAHLPGLRVAVPSTPEDVVGLFWSAFQDEDPTLILIPKHLFRVRMPARRFVSVPFGRAAIRREGRDVTVVSWGACLELAEQAADRMAGEGISLEVIDLRTLAPCDWDTIEASLAKTGRLVVIHEDNRTCGFGQAVIAEMTSRPECFDLLLSPPQLVARPDVHIPFHPDLEYSVLPDMERVLRAIHATMD